MHGLQLSEPLNDVPVLLVIPAGWSRAVRHQLLQMLLEHIGVAGVYFGEASVMAAFGCATPSALVVDIGHAVTEVAAIVEGEIVPGAYEMIPLGGRDIDTRLMALIREDAAWLESTHGQATLSERLARTLKESEAMRGDGIATFTDGSGVVMRCGEGRWRAAKVLMESSEEGDSLIDVILSVLGRCELDKRALLLDHVVLTGGSTRLPRSAV